MSRYTFLDAAVEALSSAQRPMTGKELWEFLVQLRLDKRLASVGKTPWESLGARVYVSLAEDPSSPFLRVGARPTRFWLKARSLPTGWSPDGAEESTADELQLRDSDNSLSSINPPEVVPLSIQRARKVPHERDYHPLVAHFAYTQLSGVRVKTIRHETSQKRSFGEWVHPDLVGVRFPLTSLHEKTAAFSTAAQASLLRLFSFELKKRIDFGTLRESFFQAVSNSSWAHEGYLVAVEWEDAPEFRDELERLCTSFGIGAIDLDVHKSNPKILPARRRDELDWLTIDKLVSMNPDFRDFLDSVRVDVGANKIHPSEYDQIPEEIAGIVASLASG